MANPKKIEMSFLDHLEDLRWLLVRITLAVVIVACLSYFIIDYVFDSIIFAPIHAKHFYYFKSILFSLVTFPFSVTFSFIFYIFEWHYHHGQTYNVEPII